MTAKLITENYRVPDFELVTGLESRMGQEFSVVLSDIPEGTDVFANNDKVLQVELLEDFEGTQPRIKVNALKTGSSKLQLRDASDRLIKQWLVTVFTDEAVSARISSGAPEPK